jgi:hypothetical protein
MNRQELETAAKKAILENGRDFRLSVPLVNVIRDSRISQPWA